jgi:endonuclease-8
MPEGHTLHRLARRHQRLFGGALVAVGSPQGRFAAGAAAVDGRILARAEAYGKHLFHRYERDLVVHVHLGLYGTFTEGELPAPEPVGQVRMRMVGPTHFTDLRGATSCEVLSAAEVRALTDRLGPDPLRRRPDPERAWTRLHRSRVSIAALLMDQSVIAGIGNVYRAELLFRHYVDPYLPGRDLPRDTWEAMWADLVTLMRDGVRRGRIVTWPRQLSVPPGSRSRPGAARVAVYRRTGEPCPRCGTPVRTAELVARNLFWCPTCQPAPPP